MLINAEFAKVLEPTLKKIMIEYQRGYMCLHSLRRDAPCICNSIHHFNKFADLIHEDIRTAYKKRN